MADPLSILRSYTINKKPILEDGNQLIFGEHSWPKSVKTNYLVFESEKKGSKEYYTLECLLFFLKNTELKHPAYVRKAMNAGVPFIRRPNRKDLISYLRGLTSTSSNIDKNVLPEAPVTVKQEQYPTGEQSNVESNEMSSADIDETSKLLKQVPALIAEVTDVLENLKKSVDNEEFNTQKGLSFLDLKNSNLLDYITNLTYIILKKVNGKAIQNDPAIKRLVHLRVMMEKMRPIEEKMKYQVNKLLANVSEDADSNDPLKFRANPDNLVTQEDNDGEGESEDGKETKVYVPPKISAAYYNEDSVLEQKKRALDYAQKRALSSSMLYELRQEFDTGPEEIKEMYDPHKLKISEELKERQRFEEEHMMRLPMTKKQRHEMRQLSTVTNFNTKFEDISALERTPESMQLKRKSGTKKGKFKHMGKKKGSKRKKH